ncbi:17318_t:CDS:1, partial [Cetraspora pellucida]
TEDQHHNRNHQDAEAYCQQCINNPQLYNFACGFSENANINYPILHQIDVTNSITYNHCNALKLPIESPGICCSNGKIILAEPSIPMFLQHLLSSQDNVAKDFHNKIQLYNFAFTFTFIGARYDHGLVNAQSGVYTFHVQ